MRAYCYASGLIEFGPRVPDGALPIARGRAKPLQQFITQVARHGYKKSRHDELPPLLVPGVPEAVDQKAGVDALRKFLAWIGKMQPAGVTVCD